jgi:hypothetical protein
MQEKMGIGKCDLCYYLRVAIAIASGGSEGERNPTASSYPTPQQQCMEVKYVFVLSVPWKLPDSDDGTASERLPHLVPLIPSNGRPICTPFIECLRAYWSPKWDTNSKVSN